MFNDCVAITVMLEIRDGRIKEIDKIEVVPELLNETTNVDLTILAMATATATASAPFTSNIPQRQKVIESEGAKELIKIQKVYNINEPAAEPMSNNNG